MVERVLHRPRPAWHPHHIAERYSLLVIIARGECVVGAVTAVGPLIELQGWTVEAGALALGGIALTMGVWRAYVTLPHGWLLERQPARGFAFTYAHLPLLAGVAATGAGLHVAAYAFEGSAHISNAAVVATTAVPVAALWVSMLVLYRVLMPGRDTLHTLETVLTGGLLVVSVVLAALGVPIVVALACVVLAPWVTVVVYETVGHARTSAALERIERETADRAR